MRFFSFKQELIFAIPQARALMEEHATMHWTRLFATVRCDSRENIAEVRECHFNLFCLGKSLYIIKC